MFLWKTFFAGALLLVAFPLCAREKKDATQYGMGLITNVPFSEREVTQAVQDVVQNGIIRGTKEYNKDEYVAGANPATSTHVFPAWTEGGKVFYKVRLKALDPRNFKDSGDVGTLAVRYIVQHQDDGHTVLRIDARFVEDFRHTSHPSNGSVESAEYKDIHDHLEQLELMKTESALAEKNNEEQRKHREELAVKSDNSVPTTAAPVPVQSTPSASMATAPPPAESTAAPSNVGAPVSASPEIAPAPVPPDQALEQHVKDLRRQVERLVKSPGAPLKSAPFHTAKTLQSLPAGTEVLIVVTTPYWLGVETHEGQHGWILRDELELLP